MDGSIFVQNIKKYCDLKGVKPTVACRESGVGSSFINNIERGQTPSVAKVQMLAEYLGVTTSELLGEKAPTDPEAIPPMYSKLNPENRALVDQMIEKLLKSQSDH